MSGSSGHVSWAVRAERLGRAVETILLALVLGAMILLAAAQIALRNFGGGGLIWADEALRIMVLWVTMLGAVAAGREQRHVSIDVLSRYLPARMQGGLRIGINLFVAAVCFVLTWYSWLFVADSRLVDDRVLGGSVAAWAVQSVLPAGFALLGYRYLVACLSALRESVPGSRAVH